MPRSRSTAIQSERARRRSPRLHFARQPDRAAKQQQFLGRKGTPAENLVASVLNPWSQCLLLVRVRWQVDPEAPAVNDPQCSLRRSRIEQDDEFSYAIEERCMGGPRPYLKYDYPALASGG
jgi:hypothetical protein